MDWGRVYEVELHSAHFIRETLLTVRKVVVAGLLPVLFVFSFLLLGGEAVVYQLGLGLFYLPLFLLLQLLLSLALPF